MGAEAVRRLMAAEGLGPDEVDALIVATVTPDMLFPATACLIQDRLGLRRSGDSTSPPPARASSTR